MKTCSMCDYLHKATFKVGWFCGESGVYITKPKSTGACGQFMLLRKDDVTPIDQFANVSNMVEDDGLTGMDTNTPFFDPAFRTG